MAENQTYDVVIIENVIFHLLYSWYKLLYPYIFISTS